MLHKLGHGGFSIVWLARDTQSTDRNYVALKILGASASKDVNEIAIQRWLSKSCSCFDFKDIAGLLDYFPFRDPNGRHICLVFELFGPSLNSLMQESVKMRPDAIRKIAKKVAYLIRNCHENDIAMGDVSTKNILLKLREVQEWSVAEIYDHFGRPDAWEIIPMQEDKPFPTCGPQNLYFSVDLRKGILSLIEPDVVLADLNEATYKGKNVAVPEDNRCICFNTKYAGPELLLGLEQKHTKALDIWALACTSSKRELRAHSSQVEHSIQIQASTTYSILLVRFQSDSRQMYELLRRRGGGRVKNKKCTVANQSSSCSQTNLRHQSRFMQD